MRFFGGTGEESGNCSFCINCTSGVFYDNFMLSRQREMVGNIILVELNAKSKRDPGWLLKSRSG